MLGQFGAGQSLSDGIVADVGDLAQTREQPECLKNAGINADADAGVSRLDLLQSRAGREGTLRHNSHGQAPTSTRIVDIGAQLAQSAPYGGRGGVRGRHL